LALGWCAGDRHVADEGSGGTDRAAGAGSAAPASATTSTAASSGSFSLVAGGDVLLHPELWEQAEADAARGGSTGSDFGPVLGGVASTVGAADLAICHLETPLAPAGGPYRGYPSFSVPPDIAPALAATGFDACTTASNHVFDQGADGVDRTLRALDEAGIAHAGSARTPAEAGTTTLLHADGATVALLAYTFGFNGIPPPGGQGWRSNPIDEGRIGADARTARRRGADVVVVALHWGAEHQHGLDTQQLALAPRLIRSPDIDLLLGHHAHVVQPIEAVDGEWVVYGMGNMLAHHDTPGPTLEEGLLVRFTFTESAGGWRVTAVEFDPLLVARGGSPIRLVEVGPLLDDPTTDGAFRPRLQQAWDRTSAIVAERGATQAGLRPLGMP
jgi:Bacterial capsule synthesis protein PGA_cap